MSGRPPLWLVAVAVLLLVVVPMGAMSVSNTHTASSGVTYQTNSGVAVTLGDQREIRPAPFADDRTFANGSLTISGSDANVTVTDASFSGDPLTVRDVTATGELTISRSDRERALTITDGDANVLQVRNIAIDNGTSDLAYDSDNGLTVRIENLPSIGISAVDASSGEPLATQRVDSGGVATFELPAGSRQIRFESTPTGLQVRNELNPDQLIDGNVSLSARIFTGDDATGTVIERPVENGTVSLDGLPTDEELVITVKEENQNFTYRRILIDSAVETSSIYLLPADATTAEVRFELRDETGRFDSEATKLFIEKPITRNNTTEYQTISGDRVGADGVFPTVLVDEQRYRIRVENPEGETRVLGSYTVRGPQITTLPIGEVEFSEDISEGAAMQASLREAPSGVNYTHEVRIVYFDPEGTTDDITISITNNTGAQLRPKTTEELNGTDEAYVETYPLDSFDPESDSATVSIDATQGFETKSFDETVGAVAPVGFNALDSQVLELLGLVSIVGVAGLLVIVRPAAAALVTPGWAGLLAVTDVVGIPIAGVVLAGLVGVLATLGGSRL